MAAKFLSLLAALVVSSTVGICQPGRATRQPVLPQRMQVMMDSAAHQTYNYRFDDALMTADSMISAYPDLPQGYIYKCGIYSKMLVEECFDSPDSVWQEYKKTVDIACKLSRKELKVNPDNVEGLFDYAGALVYRSRYEANGSDWLGLLSDGVKSRKVLEKAIELDPDFYDAYSGIGAFNYYAAHLPWYLKPVALILGISGNEREGITQLEKAARFGNYSKVEAASFLAEIVYTNKKEYDEVAKLTLELHDRYPGNLSFVRTLCHACYKLHDYAEVIRYADRSFARYPASDSGRFLSLAYIRFYRGESYAALKVNYNLAISDYSKAIEMGQPSILMTRAYYGRGSLYERLGMKRKAITDFESVLRLNGDDNACKQARVALDSLKGE